MSGGQWHCAINGQQQGPFTVDQLRDMAGRGGLPPDALVWTDGMADWQPLRATPLAGMLSAGAPPMPAMAPMAAPSMAASAPMAAMAGATMTGGAAPTNVGFVDAIKICFAKYIDFSGRAARPEYWWFVLFFIIVYVVAAILDGVIGTYFILTALVGLGFLIPTIAAAVRRLHDTDRSGWWYLLALVPIGNIVLLVFLCLKGTDGQNRFG